jgi:hypothetical protein
VGALEKKFWERVCDAIGRPELKQGAMETGARDRLRTIFEARTQGIGCRFSKARTAA